MTRRSCGVTCASQTAAFIHFDAHRTGCREISPAEHRERYGTDTHRAAS